MKITNNVMQPNFQAKLKNNENVTNLLRYANGDEVLQLKGALTNLSKVAPSDILEIRQEESDNPRQKRYNLVNVNNPDKMLYLGFSFDIKKLVEKLNQISVEGSDSYNDIFESRLEKDKQDVINMLA